MVQVAIMGYGTIGSGVAEILAKNAEQIKNGCGQDVALKGLGALNLTSLGEVESLLCTAVGLQFGHVETPSVS